jgi:hypothetical protein
MAKYILFQNDRFYRMAPDETKRDKWMGSPNIVAREVDDATYKNIGCKKTVPTLNGDNISYEDKDHEAIEDTERAQQALSDVRDLLVEEFKFYAAHHYDNDTEVKNMVAFLEGIDKTSVTSFAEGQEIHEYIYNLPGCPQIFPLELYY